MQWLLDHYLILLLVISEIMPLIPGVESNSICQLILNGIKQLVAEKPAK